MVEKIPEDRLSLGAVNNWFKQFGSVTNVTVDPPIAKALVTFGEHDQVRRAWKSEEAVFGNRFAKVYWHRPLEGRGGRGRTGRRRDRHHPQRSGKTWRWRRPTNRSAK